MFIAKPSIPSSVIKHGWKITALFWGEDFIQQAMFHDIENFAQTFTNDRSIVQFMESMEDHPTNRLSRDPARRLHGIFRRIEKQYGEPSLNSKKINSYTIQLACFPVILAIFRFYCA